MVVMVMMPMADFVLDILLKRRKSTLGGVEIARFQGAPQSLKVLCQTGLTTLLRLSNILNILLEGSKSGLRCA
jgi:hypothetical protein